MTISPRTLLHLLLPIVLSACAAAPPVDHETVKVRTDALTLEHSSFNARVLSDAGSVEHSFNASLAADAEPLTRLQSAYTTQIGADSEQRIRVGDTVSTSGMWGSTVRYGGMQFGTRTGARADVIDNPQLAISGLAVLPTVEQTMFSSLESRTTTLTAEDVASIAAPTVAST